MDFFSELYCKKYKYYNSHDVADLQQECLAAKVRLSILLIAGDCVGLPVFVWACHVSYRLYKSGGQVSVFMITLLLCDLLLLILNPYIVTKLLQDENPQNDLTYWILSSFWSASMFTGLHLQQVVALEGALSVRHPLFSAHVFFPSCSIIFSLIVFVSFYHCELFSASSLVLLGLPFLLVITLTSWIVTCRAPPQTDNTAYRSVKPSSAVLALVTFTLVLHVTFFPVLFVLWTSRQYKNVSVIYLCVMSLRVVTDPLLCVMVCRKNLRSPKSKIPEEPNIYIELT